MSSDPAHARPVVRIGLRRALAGLACWLAAASAPVAGVAVIAGDKPGEPGTVDTVAGPGFCPGVTERDPDASAVRDLAVDREGITYVDTGLEAEGVVRAVDKAGARLVRTGVASGRAGADALDPPAAPRAGRLAPDHAGGVLVAGGAKVVRIDASAGVALHPVAGDQVSPAGAVGTSSGDGRPALEARFASTRSIATDEAGNLFVADRIDAGRATMRIRFVNRGSEPVSFYAGTPDEMVVAPGAIDTIAGRAGDANAGDGGPARAATFAGVPPAMAAVQSKLYIGLYSKGPGGGTTQARVRVVNLGAKPVTAHGVTVAPGAVETVAGGGAAGFRGDGGPARSAAFGFVPGLAVDAQGNLYLADQAHHRVRRVGADGSIRTVAGFGGTGPADGGFNGTNRLATQALLSRPHDVEVGPNGQLYISDEGNGQLRFVDGAGVIHAAAGNSPAWRCRRQGGAGGGEAFLGDDPPESVTVDRLGTVYFLATATRRVLRLDPAGTVTPVAGDGTRDTGGKAAAGAKLNRPVAIAGGPPGGLYVVEAGGTRVRFLNLGSSPVTVHGVQVNAGAIATVAGDGTSGSAGDGRPAVRAKIGGDPARAEVGRSETVVADGKGNLFIADPAGNAVRRVDAEGTITTFAGPGAASPQACCEAPRSVAVDPAGNLYVAGREIGAPRAASRVWLFNRGSQPLNAHGQGVPAGEVRPVAGSGAESYQELSEEGVPAVETTLPNLDVEHLAVDGAGNLYFMTGLFERSVRRVDSKGILTTAVGTGRNGFNGDGLKSQLTLLNVPSSLAVDRCGDLLIADRGNSRLRRANFSESCPRLVATAPGSASPSEGGGGSGLPAKVAATAGMVALAALGFRIVRGRRSFAPRRT